MDGGPWTLYDEAQRQEDVERSTLKVVIEDMPTRALVLKGLRFNKSLVGRGLICDVPSLGLRKGNRLEPSLELMDTFTFEAQTPPFEATFW